MFVAFFYLLRQRGLDVSPNEWMTLLEGMEKGLHKSSLTGFYHLCRAIVVKSEVEFDRFDQVFLEFFKDIPFNGELPEEMLEWLEHPSEDLKRTIEELMTAGFPDETMEELLKLLQERLEEQDAEHNGGSKWVGTQGRTPWGNSGWHPNGHPDRRPGPLPDGYGGGPGSEISGLPEGQYPGHPAISDGLPAAAAAVGPDRER